MTTTITTTDINNLINYFNEHIISSRDIGIEFKELYNLTAQKDIEDYLVAYLVGFDLFRLKKGKQLIYKGFDLTQSYYEHRCEYLEAFLNENEEE
jgi:hypothetical protein